MALATGDRLGQYEVLAPLGAGGMGEAYKAHDPKLQRTVAFKVLAQCSYFNSRSTSRGCSS